MCFSFRAWGSVRNLHNLRILPLVVKILKKCSFVRVFAHNWITIIPRLTFYLFLKFCSFSFKSARILSAQYKALTEAQMKKWTKKAEQDKIRYQEEMKHYVPMEDPTGGGKRKKAKKDPNAPKRNMSAYFLFSVHIRPTVKEENPEASFGDIARIISAKYKALDVDTERKEWDDKAAADKVRYQAQMEVYRAGAGM